MRGLDDPPSAAVEPAAASEGPCPACGGPLYGWVSAPAADARRVDAYLLDRCEGCGAAVARASPAHPHAGEASRRAAADAVVALIATGTRTSVLRVPNRRSLQAALGEGRWAALDLPAHPVVLTPRAVESMLAKQGLMVERIRYPVFSRNQLWMWQTLLNALTLHPNFAREALAGRLRPSRGRGTAAFALDAVVSVVATPLIALLAFPLETVAALARRGGQLEVTLGAVKR